jgi:glutamate-5-semialdehyde dehydrogenase
VGFRADGEAAALLVAAGADVAPLQDGDFDTEWLALTLAVHIVDDLDAALRHIETHGSGHSESILTEDTINAERFVAEVDAAAVYVNASTRFTDGGAFGMGVEVAVSTMRQHPRGPVGPAQLTSLKWVGRGDYLCR